MLLTVRRRPNKTEKVFELSLNEMFPNEWKYCGDGSVLIGWKNPDYININGQKKLIELFGDYWHIEEDISVRTNHFKKYGYDTLVIWEHELKDIQAVKEKILEFNKR